MSKDTIYREDAIEVISISCGTCIARNIEDCEKCSVPKLRELINAIPSADRPQGEWISNHDGSWNCSECGLRVFIYAKGNFCPNCGARMRGGEDE